MNIKSGLSSKFDSLETRNFKLSRINDWTYERDRGGRVDVLLFLTVISPTDLIKSSVLISKNIIRFSYKSRYLQVILNDRFQKTSTQGWIYGQRYPWSDQTSFLVIMS